MLTSCSNLVPGGWIEQIEFDCNILSDDDTLPADSILANLGAVCEACCERSGRPLDVVNTMRAGIEAVGFINVQETNYKCPIGTWPKHPIYKDAGRVNSIQWKVRPLLISCNTHSLLANPCTTNIL